MSETTLKEAVNQVTIVGIVAELNFEEKELDGKDAITGSMMIRTDDGSEHEVDVFSYKMKKDGTENSIYKGLQTIMNEYKSIAKHGVEEADRVSVTNAKITLNDFYTPTGELRSSVRLNTNFINRVNVKADEKFETKAEFALEAYVSSILDEFDRAADAPSGRKILKVIVPIYNGKVIPLTLIAADEELIAGIESLYEEGQTVKVWGNLINKVTIETRTETAALGKSREVVTKLTTRELMLTGGSEPYLDDAKIFDKVAIKKALDVRAEDLEALKTRRAKNAVKNSASASSTSASDEPLPF